MIVNTLEYMYGYSARKRGRRMKLNSCEDCPLRREDEVSGRVFYACGLLNLTDEEKKMVISIPANCEMERVRK